jgi:hypothetical protein
VAQDFAQRVLVAAREKLRRRQLRKRVALAATGLLLAAIIPLAALRHTHRDNLASRESATAKMGWQESSADETLAYEMAQNATSRSAGDYLLPNAAALTGFTSAYGDASWQYDPTWASNR